MITLTNEEALIILKAISQVEGFLFSVNGSGLVAEMLDHPVDILTYKLSEAKK
jgi:hypothetical protein